MLILVDSDLAREEDKKIFEMDFGFGFNPNLHNFNFMTNIPFF
jgi:hypothetical protein